MPTAVISLLSWDSHRYLEALFEDLERHPPGGGTIMAVVDQGSEPRTQALIREFAARHGWIVPRFLRNNIGYAAGHNLAYELLRRRQPFDYFVTINNDLRFGRTGWLDTLVAAMEAHPKAALGGPECAALRASAAPDAPDYVFITGAVTIIRAAVAERYGLFDAAFTPAYGEDVDMCRRYELFGFHQLPISIPFEHEYLADAERVGVAKRRELADAYGDFNTANKRLVHARWWADAPPVGSAAELPAAFPKLYIPGRA